MWVPASRRYPGARRSVGYAVVTTDTPRACQASHPATYLIAQKGAISGSPVEASAGKRRIRSSAGCAVYDRGVRLATVLLVLTRIVEERIIRYMIVDSAIYVDGRRAGEPTSLQETYVVCREQHGLPG